MYRNIFRLKNKPLLEYQELDYEVRDSSSIDPYDSIGAIDIYNELDNYLYSLSIEDAAIITLRLNDFKYREIRELLDVSSSHINKVVKALKEKFQFCS